MWLQGVGKDEDRPDQSKVVLDSWDVGDGVSVLMIFETSAGGLNTKLAKEREEQALSRQISVCRIAVNGERTLVMPIGVEQGKEIVETFRKKFPLIRVYLRI